MNDFIVNPWLLLASFPVLLICLLIFFFTGKFCIYICPPKLQKGSNIQQTASLFFCIFIGIFLWISVYAIFITAFKTILLPVPILLFFFIRSYKLFREELSASNSLHAGPFSKKYNIVYASLLLTWLYQASGFITFSKGVVKYIGGDTEFYGREALYLNYARKENVSLDYLNQLNVKVEPYHYGDLWLTGLINQVSTLNPVVVTALITYPLFATLFVAGLKDYIGELELTKGFRALSSLIFVLGGFFSGISYLYPETIISASSYSIPLLQYPKVLLAACILIATLIPLKLANIKLAVIVTCIGILLFINVAPAITITIFLILFYVSLRWRKCFSNHLASYLFLVGTLCFYCLFYFLLDGGRMALEPGAFSFITFRNIVLGGLLQYCTLIPFFLMLAFVVWPSTKKARELVTGYDKIYLAIITFAGLLAAGFLYNRTPEAIQFFNNVFIPASAIFIVLCFKQFLSFENAYLKIGAIALFLLVVILNFKFPKDSLPIAKDDLDKAKKFVQKYPFHKFVNYRLPVEFRTYFEKNTVFLQPLPFFTYLISPYQNASLNVLDAPADSTTVYSGLISNLINNSPFSLFRKSNSIFSREQSEMEFIFERGFPLVTVSPRVALPFYLKRFVRDSVALSTGWRIYYVTRAR